MAVQTIHGASRSAQAHYWRERMASGQASRADRQAFERWLSEDVANQHAYDRAKTVWDALGAIEASGYDAALYRPSFRERFFHSVDRAGDVLVEKRLRFAAAAAVVGALTLALVIPGIDALRPSQPAAPLEQAQYLAPIGQMKTFTLADGTVVTLGPDSRFETAFSSTRRRVTLFAGAAYFDVHSDKDRPFMVEAGTLTARAIGTAFDVRFNGGVGRVAVAEGQVRVTMPTLIDGKDIGLRSHADLTTGEEVASTKADGLRDKVSIDPQAVGAWRQNRLSYIGGTLEELITDAARYSRRDIRLEGDIGALEVTIAYDAEDIDALLRTLTKVLPISATVGADTSVSISARDTQ
ncbi:MAG: FecR domain-containing protein [Sphingomonadales bacterium]